MKNQPPKKYKFGTIKKYSEYIKIDIIKLAAYEIIELNDIYIGSKKELKNRLIVRKLTEKTNVKIENTFIENVRKKNMILRKSRIIFNRINSYITNVSSYIITMKQVKIFY